MHEIGNEEIGNVEIVAGEEQAEATRRVIERARDNRQPAPKMRAVPTDAPAADDPLADWMTDTFLGEAVFAGADQFPLTSRLLLRFGGGQVAPRVVRVDTEESYARFREESSPELAALRERVEDLHAALAEHVEDPDAHGAIVSEMDDLTVAGAEAEESEAAKRVDLFLPAWADQDVCAWQDGEYVCASVRLPGPDGKPRICTAVEPIERCVAEMERHASEADVDAAAVVGCLPAMGVVLGAGTVVKEIAAAAPAILRRPEVGAGGPFTVRIEPKVAPGIAALAALAWACAKGSAEACDEWRRLGEAAKRGGAAPVAQAMREVVTALKAA